MLQLEYADRTSPDIAGRDAPPHSQPRWWTTPTVLKYPASVTLNGDPTKSNFDFQGEAGTGIS
jgi:hypothetical protein